MWEIFAFSMRLVFGNRVGLSRLPMFVDHLLLAVVLVSGAEQMSAFLKMVGAHGGGTPESATQPVRVSGKRTLGGIFGEEIAPRLMLFPLLVLAVGLAFERKAEAPKAQRIEN